MAFSKWAIAQHCHAFDSAVLSAMVRHRIVLGASVVPLGDAVLSPVFASLNLAAVSAKSQYKRN